MARLYLEKGYRPEGTKLDEIIGMLDITARNCNEEAINLLIKIYSDEAFSYKDLNKVYEYIKLGAVIGIPDKMYDLGVSFMGDKEEIFNAYKGLEWIEKAARKDHLPAIEYLLDAFNGEKYKDQEKLSEWSLVAARLHLDSEESYPLICDGLISVKAKEELKAYLIYVIENKGTNAVCALKTLFTEHFNGLIELDEKEYSLYSKRVFDYLKKSNDESVLPLQSIVHKLDLDFTPSKVEDEPILEGELFDKYYKYFWASGFNLFDLDQKDEVLNGLYAPMRIDCSFAEVRSKSVSEITGHDSFWDTVNNFFDLYVELCQRYSIRPIDFRRIEKDKLLPFIPSCLADSLGRDILRCFISLYQSGQDEITDCKQPISDDALLDVAERCTDTTIQLYLITFVEAHIEMEAVLLENLSIYKSYINDDMPFLSQKLNGYKERLDKLDIFNTLPEFNADFINNMMKSEIEEKTKEKGMDDDEFNRLLDEFIDNQLKENSDD